MEKYILITGATSGIGLSLIKQIVEKYGNSMILHIVVACRNTQKGQNLKNKLIENHPSLKLHVVKMDIGIVSSVLQGCQEIKTKCPHLDCIFLNAGIMPVSNLNWKYMGKKMLALEAVDMFRTGNGVFAAIDPTTEEGLKSIFATNVLGHFVLVQELLPLLGKTKSQLIWTTSTNANRSAFDAIDYMCQKGTEPYASSKYIINALSMEMNNRLNSKDVYSHLADPGTVVTNITSNILPPIVWYLLTPIMWLMRFLLPELTISPHTACFSMLWLFEQDPASLKPHVKYCSRATVLNQVYVNEEPLEITWTESNDVYELLSTAADKTTTKIRKQ